MINNIVRIKDIAKKAGVSTGTVDRVIHDRGRVSKKVKEDVLKILEEMNYEPNLMARALGSHKVYLLAALIPNPLTDSFWEAPKSGIEKAEKDLKQYGIVVKQYIFNPYDVNSFIEKANEVSEDNVDGIILSPIFYRQSLLFFEKWKNQNIPFVLFNTQIAEYDPLSYIGQDSFQSGCLAGKLLQYGLPDPCSVLIAHIDEEISNAAHLITKEQGFRNYFTKNKLDKKYTILRIELNRCTQKVFNKRLDEIISNTPDLAGIFVTTSKAHVIAKYLEDKKISNIKIIGYDLISENIHYLNNGSISFLINQNPKGQGFWGIHHLADYLVFKKKVPGLKYLPLDIVTKENLSYYVEEGNNLADLNVSG
ncbi:substrate-binding domain-containing protein [Segetibacter koreensis]|uniref:substrate-binding domain-containing protein n=1 Tax=Segetibacter koreensis TaxID=398037 RepID=UPI00035FAB89|nr:substrate-binding domain-containing protein [Segetibacter koreensis]